jgi:hypothetical protein
MFSEPNVISFERVKALQPCEDVGSKSVTLRLSGQTLELFNELEQVLDKPGAMAYFRDGLWLAALAISHDAQGQKVKLCVEYSDSKKSPIRENLLDGFRLHSLRKWLERNLFAKKPSKPVPLHKGTATTIKKRAKPVENK